MVKKENCPRFKRDKRPHGEKNRGMGGEIQDLVESGACVKAGKRRKIDGKEDLPEV